MSNSYGSTMGSEATAETTEISPGLLGTGSTPEGGYSYPWLGFYGIPDSPDWAQYWIRGQFTEELTGEDTGLGIWMNFASSFQFCNRPIFLAWQLIYSEFAIV